MTISNGGSHLDSHANMCVFGKHCYVISRSSKFCHVSGFSDGIGKLQKVLVVDAVVAYDCYVTHQCYLLIARNILYVPAMEHNLIPPFILRQVNGII